jgi:hypothetical protein
MNCLVFAGSDFEESRKTMRRQKSIDSAAKVSMLIVVLTLLPGVACGDQAYWTVLPINEAVKMKEPCSRPFPKGLSGSWMPTAEDIARAEVKLPKAIDAAFGRLRGKDRHARPDRHYRQYAGFLRNGKRVLYVQGLGRDMDDEPGWKAFSESWRSRFVSFCDSGRGSFGAVYNLDKGAFDTFVFDGTFAGPLPGGGW